MAQPSTDSRRIDRRSQSVERSARTPEVADREVAHVLGGAVDAIAVGAIAVQREPVQPEPRGVLEVAMGGIRVIQTPLSLFQ